MLVIGDYERIFVSPYECANDVFAALAKSRQVFSGSEARFFLFSFVQLLTPVNAVQNEIHHRTKGDYAGTNDYCPFDAALVVFAFVFSVVTFGGTCYWIVADTRLGRRNQDHNDHHKARQRDDAHQNGLQHQERGRGTAAY
jgi:hypothetical protein